MVMDTMKILMDTVKTVVPCYLVTSGLAIAKTLVCNLISLVFIWPHGSCSCPEWYFTFMKEFCHLYFFLRCVSLHLDFLGNFRACLCNSEILLFGNSFPSGRRSIQSIHAISQMDHRTLPCAMQKRLHQEQPLTPMGCLELEPEQSPFLTQPRAVLPHLRSTFLTRGLSLDAGWGVLSMLFVKSSIYCLTLCLVTKPDECGGLEHTCRPEVSVCPGERNV